MLVYPLEKSFYNCSVEVRGPAMILVLNKNIIDQVICSLLTGH